MKQTAVEWLVNELNQKIDFIPIHKWDEIRDIIQQAKAMEKEQIIDAFIACWKANVPDGIECKVSFKEWFEQNKKK